MKTDPWWIALLPLAGVVVGATLGQVFSMIRESATRRHATALAERAEREADRVHLRELLDDAAVSLAKLRQAISDFDFEVAHGIALIRKDADGEVPDHERESFEDARTTSRASVRGLVDAVQEAIVEANALQARMGIRFEREAVVLSTFDRARVRLVGWASTVGGASDACRTREVDVAEAKRVLAKKRSKVAARRRREFEAAARDRLAPIATR